MFVKRLEDKSSINEAIKLYVQAAVFYIHHNAEA